MESRQPTPIDGGLNQQYQREALKRRGPGVDRHVKILIHLAAKGSLLDAYSQLRRIGLVAIGREFAADLAVARIDLMAFARRRNELVFYRHSRPRHMFKPQRLEPKAGQESAWDYPRPPRLEKVGERLRVVFNGRTIADTRAGCRVLETSHPPVYYLPPSDAAMEFLQPETGHSWCEFKGQANYWSLNVIGRRSVKAAWSYPAPSHGFREIAGYLAFYASRVDECWVDDERVQPQGGDFYGGWITSRIVGPFKGAAGTSGW